MLMLICGIINPSINQGAHRGAFNAALVLFDEHANMGSEAAIAESRYSICLYTGIVINNQSIKLCDDIWNNNNCLVLSCLIIISQCNYNREGLIKEMEAERSRYFETNSLRNPFRDLERYVLTE